MIGGTIPGLPAVLTGRSGDLGWGLTSSYMDDQDLYIEKLDPDNSTRYLTPEGYKPFRTQKSIIRINDADPVTMTLRWTDNGPVLPGSHYDLASVTPEGHVAALAWTALAGDDTTMSAAMAVMRASSVEEALDAGRLYVAPSQNLTLVDSDSIAMKTLGAMPRRNASHESEGRMPSRGWVRQNRWQGISPYSANPEFIAPAGAFWGIPTTRPWTVPFRCM